MLVTYLGDKSEGVKCGGIREEKNLTKKLILRDLGRWFTGKVSALQA